MADRRAYDSIYLLPRYLRFDLSKRCLRTKILGVDSSLPIIIAPTAMNRLVNEDGEVAVARAAAKANVVQTLSTLASRSLEDVAAPGGSLWFQLYIFKERSLTQNLVKRCEKAGYKAIVLTVDVPAFGLRDVVTRAGFKSPPSIKLANFENKKEASDELLKGNRNDLFSFWIDRLFTLALSENIDPSLNWNDVAWLKSITHLPIILKGVMSPLDADRAVEMGVSGIIVSNHGARQLDTGFVSYACVHIPLACMCDSIKYFTSMYSVAAHFGVATDRRGGSRSNRSVCRWRCATRHRCHQGASIGC